MLAIGVILWTLYIIVLNIVLSFTQYALVIDELEPLEALSASFHFFLQNKLDVFFVWMIYIGLAFITTFIRDYFGSNSILVSALTYLFPVVFYNL